LLFSTFELQKHVLFFSCEPTRVKFCCAFAPHKTANLDFSGTKRPAAHVLRMKDLKNIEMHLLL
jgi:hypothetical protein